MKTLLISCKMKSFKHLRWYHRLLILKTCLNFRMRTLWIHHLHKWYMFEDWLKTYWNKISKIQFSTSDPSGKWAQSYLIWSNLIWPFYSSKECGFDSLYLKLYLCTGNRTMCINDNRCKLFNFSLNDINSLHECLTGKAVKVTKCWWSKKLMVIHFEKFIAVFDQKCCTGIWD